MRVLAWGTYDINKPRVRILLRGLKENQVEVIECHKDVWGNIEDKSQITGLKNKISKALKWGLSYPWLIWMYIKQPKHDAIFINYLGQLDILLIWPFAKLRGTPIVWDAFLSLYNTVVEDRKLVSRHNPIAWLLYSWEWLACRAADVIILDTQAHGNYFIKKYSISNQKVKRIFVGVETEIFPPNSTKNINETPIVLFYGQCIPLHGIETIINAARLAKNDNIQWIVIGSGQEERRLKAMLKDEPLDKLQWISWVKYHELIDWIHKADICLGVFGNTGKAARVIPNKVFQILSSGMPLITMDSPAIRELLNENMPGIKLVPPGDDKALLNKIIEMISELDSYKMPLHKNLLEKINPTILGKELKHIFELRIQLTLKS